MLGDLLRKGADAWDARAPINPERIGYLNASEAMSCIRKQWYEKNGAPKDAPEDWGYARRGKHGEEYIVSRLRAANAPLLFAGEEQVGVADDELGIRATPDGVLLDMEDAELMWGVEFKTVDPRTNIGRLPRIDHVTQLQIAMALFERFAEEFIELEGRRFAGGIVMYMDASNYNVVHEYRVPHAPKILERLKGRASRLAKARSADRLPREGKEGGGRECQTRCSFRGICGVDGASTSTGQGHRGGGDLSELRHQFLGAKEAEEAAKAARAQAGELIKAALLQEGVSSVDVDDGSVQLTTRAGAVAYAKIVKEHLPDLDLDPYRGAPVETLTVK